MDGARGVRMGWRVEAHRAASITRSRSTVEPLLQRRGEYARHAPKSMVVFLRTRRERRQGACLQPGASRLIAATAQRLLEESVELASAT